MTDPVLGAVLAGKYEIRRVIGRGGMGAVYEGRHLGIDKRVAIKVLDPAHAQNQELVARFRNEARAASRVESDHVVHVFDVGEEPGVGVYLVMEFLEGEDLAERLARDGVIEVALALDIAWQAARGLAKAHSAGVVHRDLKPANVFLSARDKGAPTVKIVDFGISKLLSEELSREGAPGITRWGSAVGTPQYMSPEQAQGKPVDARTDVWSLGAVLYEMLAGKPAYPMLENYEQTIFSIVLNRPVPLSEVAPWVSPRVVQLVTKAMEIDLDTRIQDCSMFAKIIETLREDGAAMPLGDAEARTAFPLTRPANSPPSSRRQPHVAASAPMASMTTSGVAAQPATQSDAPPESRKPRGRGALVIALTLAAVGIGVGGAMIIGKAGVGRREAASIAEGARGSSEAPAIESASATTAVVERAAVSSASTNPSGSASVASSASGKPPFGKPVMAPKPIKVVKPGPASTGADPQFGGVGVSPTY